MSRDENAIRSHSIMTDNSLFDGVDQLKDEGTTLTNQNSIRKEIKSSLQPGNSCYYSVHHFWSSSLLSKNIKFKTYKTLILPVILYGCEIWSLTLREERRLRLFENRVLRRLCEPVRAR